MTEINATDSLDDRFVPLRWDEVFYLAQSRRCCGCEHLDVFHHDDYCLIDECGCSPGDEPPEESMMCSSGDGHVATQLITINDKLVPYCHRHTLSTTDEGVTHA